VSASSLGALMRKKEKHLLQREEKKNLNQNVLKVDRYITV
jgi:hypothetical protein